MPWVKSKLNRGPNIVAIGGGTGLSTLLKGLKNYSSNITAIVTVSDDGEVVEFPENNYKCPTSRT